MKTLSTCVILAVVLMGCGENLENPTPTTQFPPPTGLKALSVSQSSIRVQWTAPAGSTDSTFAGYIVQLNGRSDTIPPAALTFRADSLPAGVATFSVYALRTDGLRSDPASIRWAPAARFDTVYSVYERTTLVSTRPEGFNVGTSTTDPAVMVIDPDDPVVQQTLDLFFNGDSIETLQSLSMWSANLLLGTFHQTLFSTQTDAAPDLDFPLSAFPPENTFVMDSMTVVDNMIYYAKVVGDPQQVNYARIHLHIRAGTYPPNRIIEIRVSLQRVPGLLFAYDADIQPWGLSAMHPLITHYHSQSTEIL